MKRLRRSLLAIYSLMFALSSLILVQASALSQNVSSYGTINPSPMSLTIKRYADDTFLRGTDTATFARLFDSCQAWPWDAAIIQQIHQIRPDFKALLYREVRTINDQAYDEWQVCKDNNWSLRDANGQLVYDTRYLDHCFVDVGNPQYQKWVANLIKQNIEQYGFDGVMADNSLYASTNEIFWAASSQPINPRTGVLWTDKEVRCALLQIHAEIKNAIGSKLLACNGILDGHRFWSRYDEYMEYLSNSSLDGVASENLWYDYNGFWMEEADWLKSLKLLVVMQNILSQSPTKQYCICCSLESPLPNNCDKERMLMYAFASSLLGIGTSQTYLDFGANIDFTSKVIQPLFDLNLGGPIGDYYEISGTHVFARNFSKAKILVNPTPDAYTIDLQGVFGTLNGQQISEITMGGHNGTILIRAS